jgi:hypothetical protein
MREPIVWKPAQALPQVGGNSDISEEKKIGIWRPRPMPREGAQAGREGPVPLRAPWRRKVTSNLACPVVQMYCTVECAKVESRHGRRLR